MLGDVVVTSDVPGEFAERVIECWHVRPSDHFSLVLSGGATARRCYERLAEVGAAQVDWWQVDLYWGDERCVPEDHPDSNAGLAREALMDRVGAVNAYYPMRCEDGPDPYQLRLGELGRLDIVHLGLGADGHTASLFPESSALDADEGRLVVMNRDPRGEHPHERMTLTYAGIERARVVVVTVMGADKAPAMAAVARGDDVPATHLRAERVIWLVDPAAASELP